MGDGKIIQVFPDKHGLIKNFMVKTKISELIRPITKVRLLVKRPYGYKHCIYSTV